MPIYEYKCLDCGAQVEKMQKTSDEPLRICEVCGGKLEKQWSLSGFQFKGAGWYVTDYSSKLKDTSAEKKGATEKTENSSKTEDAKKSSSIESTAAPQSASKESKDAAPASKKETTAKKD